jgi:hypothetical protein
MVIASFPPSHSAPICPNEGGRHPVTVSTPHAPPALFVATIAWLAATTQLRLNSAKKRLIPHPPLTHLSRSLFFLEWLCCWLSPSLPVPIVLDVVACFPPLILALHPQQPCHSFRLLFGRSLHLLSYTCTTASTRPRRGCSPSASQYITATDRFMIYQRLPPAPFDPLRPWAIQNSANHYHPRSNAAAAHPNSPCPRLTVDYRPRWP